METGYKLSGKSYVQPDVSVTHAAQPEGKYFGDAPAIAVEVISPSNTANEMETKVALYFRHGVREVWRVYRKTRRIVVHVGGASHTFLEHDVLTTPLLPGFALRVDEILGPVKLPTEPQR
jgi:Uma2 family endonuclease